MMKKLLLILTMPIVLSACQSKSYYKAMNTNKQRFDGWQEDNAVFMNETHDLALLISDISALAQKRANLRETYLLAEKAQELIDDLEASYKVETTILRIKLASSLSEKSDNQLHKLKDISKENFDTVYLQFLHTNLDKLKQQAVDYVNEGHNKRLKDFAEKLVSTVDKIKKEADSVEIS